MVSKIVIPALGATGGDVVIEQWLVKPGDRIEAGAPIATVSTDKANVDIEAFRGGYIRALLVEGGATVPIGDSIALIADSMEEPVGTLADSPSPRDGERGSQQRIIPRVQSNVIERPSPLPSPRDGAREKISPAFSLIDSYRTMVLIRRFEDYLYQLFLQGLVPGTLHQCQGQEASAVGVCAALRTDDVLFSTHRPVGHMIAKRVSLRSIAAEIWGKATGCAGGKGGQMHLGDMSVGVPPSNAIDGANIPIATGAALGFKLRKLDRVAVSFFGDGAANIGPFHEGINLAAVKDAPVVFVCENNLYGASTHASLAMKVKDVAARAAAYGIPGVVVDGMDVVAVHDAASKAVAHARAGKGPTLLELKTYRYLGHSRGDPCGYRSKEEVEHWRQRDPIPRCREILIKEHGQQADALRALEESCQAEVEDAVRFAQHSPEPPVESTFEHVYAPREVST